MKKYTIEFDLPELAMLNEAMKNEQTILKKGIEMDSSRFQMAATHLWFLKPLAEKIAIIFKNAEENK